MSAAQHDHYNHARLGHMSQQKQMILSKLGLLATQDIVQSKRLNCEACILGSSCKDPYHPVIDMRAVHPNHTLCCDLLVMPQPDLKKRKYILVVMDEYTRYAFAFLLHTKSEAKTHLQTLLKRANVLHSQHPVKYLHHDGGGEFANTTMDVARAELGIEKAYIPPACHQSNGMIERLNRTIALKVRTLLADSHLPNYLWGEAALHVIHLYNLTPHRALQERGESVPIPHALYMGDNNERLKRLYNQLLPFGLPCHVLDVRDHIPKLDPRAAPGFVIGVGDSTMFYKVLQYKPTPRISVVRHIHVSSLHYNKYLDLVGHTTLETIQQLQSVPAPTTDTTAVAHLEERLIDSQRFTLKMWQVIEDFPFFKKLEGEDEFSYQEKVNLQHCRNEVERLRLGMANASSKVCVRHHENHTTTATTTDYTTHAEAEPRGGTTACGTEEQATSLPTFQAGEEGPVQPHLPGLCDGQRGIRPCEPALHEQGRRGAAFGLQPKLRTKTHANPQPFVQRWGECELKCLRQVYLGDDEFSPDCVEVGSVTTPSVPDETTQHVLHDSNDNDHNHDTTLHICSALDCQTSYLMNSDEPTLAQAKSRDDFVHFETAMQDELASLVDHDVFTLVARPHDKVIKGRWVFKIKRNPDHSIDRYKARYVAKGFLQEFGVNYHDTWAPTAHLATVRLLFARAVIEDMEVRHIDIKCAFLNGDLDECVYLEQPPHVSDGTSRVWKLKKAIYGLKQAGRQWHHKLSESMEANNYTRSQYDPALFIHNNNSRHALLMWVDDLFILGTKQANDTTIQQILSDFEGRDLGEARHLLGMEIFRDWESRTIQLSQRHMIEEKLEQFGLTQSATATTPLMPNQAVQRNPHNVRGKKIDEDTHNVHQQQQDSQPLDKALHDRYMSIVGSLQYIAIVTRPDIAFAASALARYMSNPTRFLLKCAERTLRYLGKTKNLSLTYCGTDKASEQTLVLGYSDADYAGCMSTAKSTSGMLITYQGLPIYWRSKRQPIVTISTAEAELVALTDTALQVQWLQMLLSENFKFNTTNKLLCDNRATTRIAEDPICSQKTRHIEVRFKKVQEYVEGKKTKVEWIPTDLQHADVFTKSLPNIKLQEARTHLCLEPCVQGTKVEGEC
jgi:hypothetical protein